MRLQRYGVRRAAANYSDGTTVTTPTAVSLTQHQLLVPGVLLLLLAVAAVLAFAPFLPLRSLIGSSLGCCMEYRSSNTSSSSAASPYFSTQSICGFSERVVVAVVR
jgi:hypothetical protein